MSYKVPDEETLSKAIRSTLIHTPHIDSQRELVELVNKELSKLDGDYRASGERIRRVGVEKDLIRIDIDYHEVEKELPEVCPVCKNAMSPIKNMSLEGQVVEVKRRCTVCSYNVGQKMMMPSRYNFTRVSRPETSDISIRIRKLEKARSKLKEASRLINDALDMTNIGSRGNHAKEILNELMDSVEHPGSISNLIADLKSNNDDAPIWTRPTVSVKNTDRKDI